MPLEIYNHCPDTLWPAIFTTSGGGPSTGGFELAAGANKSLEVDANWYGRVWARTNCTSSDDAFICQTGSCGVLDCAALAVSQLRRTRKLLTMHHELRPLLPAHHR